MYSSSAYRSYHTWPLPSRVPPVVRWNVSPQNLCIKVSYKRGCFWWTSAPFRCGSTVAEGTQDSSSSGWTGPETSPMGWGHHRRRGRDARRDVTRAEVASLISWRHGPRESKRSSPSVPPPVGGRARYLAWLSASQLCGLERRRGQGGCMRPRPAHVRSDLSRLTAVPSPDTSSTASGVVQTTGWQSSSPVSTYGRCSLVLPRPFALTPSWFWGRPASHPGKNHAMWKGNPPP